MSYKDSEEFKEEDIEEDGELAPGSELDDPLDDDISMSEELENDDLVEGFASLDGAEYN